jgi:TRAP-type C4-dicarboxylate transport system substrate-binding protein
MNHRFAVATAAVVLAFVPIAAKSQTVQLQMLSSWVQSYDPRVFIAERYIELVGKASGGAIKVEIRGPETVPSFQQLQPVKAGLFDFLHTHGIYHFGEKGLAASVDAIDPDPKKRREVGIFQLIDEFYQKTHGIKLIGLTSGGSTGYHIMLKKPIPPDGDWAGRKIRGTRSYHGIIRALGGAPVVLPPGEIYPALERGVVDGSAWPTSGALGFKWYEVAKFRVRPSVGVATLPIFMNLRKFQSLSPKMQELLLEEGQKLEIETLRVGDELQAKEDTELDRLGMKILQLSEANGSKLKKAWSDSMWELAKECCDEWGQRLHDLAVKNNMEL